MIRRSPIRHKPRPKADRVTPELVEYVYERDHYRCVLAQLVPGHVCSGRPTLEHVKDEACMGKRAPSDRRHLVVACYGANVETVETSKYRPVLREYLRRVEG